MVEERIAGKRGKWTRRKASAGSEARREPKRAEEAIAKASEELRESESKFRSIVANVPSAIYRCASDKNWTMEFISDAIEKITGYPPSDFVENRVRSYASVIHPDDRTHVAAAVEGGVARKKSFETEYPGMPCGWHGLLGA